MLDGVALAEAAYGDPALRHCAAIDLLLRANDLPRAAGRLSAMLSTPPGTHDVAGADPLTLRHGSGLQVELRSQLALKRDHPVSLDNLFAASRAETVAGIPARPVASGPTAGIPTLLLPSPTRLLFLFWRVQAPATPQRSTLSRAVVFARVVPALAGCSLRRRREGVGRPEVGRVPTPTAGSSGG